MTAGRVAGLIEATPGGRHTPCAPSAMVFTKASTSAALAPLPIKRFVWDHETEELDGVPSRGGAIGATSPTIVDGMMYMGSGYSIFGSRPGNVLLAFEKDE